MKPHSQFHLSSLVQAPLAYWLGWIYYKQGRWAGAERRFALAVRTAPRHAPSHFQRGMVEFKRERWELAFSHMSEALKLEPSRTDWMVQFCQTAKHLKGSQAKAMELCTSHILQRISEDQGSAALHSELAAIYRIQGRAWLEDEALKNALALSPDDASLLFRLGQVSERMTRNEEAAEFYRRSAELDPQETKTSVKAGFMLESTGNSAAAQTFYDRAVASDSKWNSGRFGIGVLHAAAGHWRAAADAYSRDLAKHPGDAHLLYLLGTAHDRLNAWPEAIEHYRAAIALDGSNPEWHRRLGTLQEKLGNFQDAAASYRRLLEFPEFKGHSVWLYRLGYALDHAGLQEEACTTYEVVDAGSDPADGNVIRSGLSALSRSLKPGATGSRKRYSTAAEITARLEKDATAAADWFDLGTALEAAGDKTGAESAYRQAATRSGDHAPQYWHRLGRSLAALGKHREACEAYRHMRILQRNPGIAEDHFRRHAKFRRTASYVEYSEVLPLLEKTVLYESFHGRMLSCNPFALFLHLLASPDHADWTHIWVVEDLKLAPERFKALRNVIFITRDSDACLRYLATAAVLINNVTFPSHFTRRDGQIYLNTWHGTPWKTLGRDAAGEFMTHGNVARNLLQASHIASPNRHTSDALMTSFNLDGIFNGAILETGSPRVDLTLHASAAAKQALRTRLGVPEGRQVVLYAPTWRGTLKSPYHEVAATQEVIRTLQSTDCHLLFRGHYFVESALESADAALVPPLDISTNELLSIVDVLVTDYSSVFFDFLATGRPVIFHLDDHADYVANRGLYFDIAELPGPVTTTAGELATRVTETLRGAPPHPLYAAAKEHFCHMEDGHACQRVIDFILGKTPAPAVARDGKRTLLIFGGHFSLNGITIALINLLRAVDHDRLRVVVIVEMGGISLSPESTEYLKALPPQVRILPRSGAANTTLDERRVIGEFNRSYTLEDGSPAFETLRHHYRREEQRLFGSAHFDAAIDYSGYTSFFASLFGFAGRSSIGHKAIYQHNEMYGEWVVKYPELERVFHLYRQYDHLISVSPGARNLNRDQLAERFGVPASRFDFVENPVDIRTVMTRAEEAMEDGDEARFFVPGTIVFVTIGRLSVEKDHRKLIEAFARVHAARPESRLLILGDGPLAMMLDLLVEKLGLRGIVHLAGYRFNPFPYLKRADCFVFSSNHEGQGLVLLEAMMLSRPIVCADIEVCRGVVENRSGLLVENSVDGLYQGMLDFLAGRITVRQVDFEHYQETAMEMFYRKTCGFAPAGETVALNEP
ncbi:MAG: CDP-glycerol glycerophosphotransferase family protein [Verrucomicrobiota bacterium]